MDFDAFVSDFLGNLPQDVALEFSLPELSGLLPTQVDFLSMLKVFAPFAACALVLGLLSRLVFGKRSGANHAVSSAMGILFIYVLTIVIYTFKPMQLEQFLSPLPFVGFAGEYLSLFSFQSAPVNAICYEVLSLLILAFLVNLMDTFLPEGKGPVAWFLWRFFTVLLSMGAHLVVRWAFSSFLPDVLIRYAPMILLGVLGTTLLLGFAKVIVSLVLTAADPVLGGIYTFFFSNLVGKQLIKSLVSTGILCALVFALEYLGVSVVAISQAALIAYLPLLAILLVLWFVIGHIL